MENAQIAEKIKNKCKENKVSMTLLLSECSINKNFIYDLEKRGKSPSADKLTKIADYLDCSVDYLLGRTDNPKTINAEMYIEGNNNIGKINDSDIKIDSRLNESNTNNNLSEIEIALSKLSGAKRHRVIANILDLIEKEYTK